MKDKFNSDYYNVFRKDIDDIFDKFDSYIANLDDWYFDQSVILEDDKSIVFKSICDGDKKLGNQIITKCFGDNASYNLIILDNFISLTVSSYENNNLVKESRKITFEDNVCIRECSVSVNDNDFKYREMHDFNGCNTCVIDSDFSYECLFDKSLDEIIGVIKNSCDILKKSKVLKRSL